MRALVCASLLTLKFLTDVERLVLQVVLWTVQRYRLTLRYRSLYPCLLHEGSQLLPWILIWI